MVDDAVGALGGAEGYQLGDDPGDGVGFGADGPRAGAAAERTQAAFDPLLLFGEIVIYLP